MATIRLALRAGGTASRRLTTSLPKTAMNRLSPAVQQQGEIGHIRHFLTYQKPLDFKARTPHRENKGGNSKKSGSKLFNILAATTAMGAMGLFSSVAHCQAENPPTPTHISDLFDHEMAMLAEGNNPDAPKSDLVLCLSGRMSVLGGGDANAKKRMVDPTEDIDRLMRAFDVAEGGVPVVYNATDEANRDLRNFFDACKGSKSLDQFKEKIAKCPVDSPINPRDYLERHYNDEKLTKIFNRFKEMEPRVIIIGKGIKNTMHQAESMNGFLKDHPDVKTMHIVTDGFHIPRSARIFGDNSSCAKNPDGSLNYLGKTQLIFSGTDLQCERPGKDLDLGCDPTKPNEPNAIFYYTDPNRKGKIMELALGSNVQLGRNPRAFKIASDSIVSQFERGRQAG